MKPFRLRMGLAMRYRRWRNSEAASTVIGIVRYLPYVLVVAGLKIYVMMLLIHSRSVPLADQVYNYDDPDYTAHTDAFTPSPQPKAPPEDRWWDEKQRVLARLNTTQLEASQHNRTPSTIWLFFNRLPRTGGQTMVSLIQSLAQDLDYQHQGHVYRTPWQRLMSEEEQRNLATWFEYNFWPKSYDRFSLYINFTQHRSPYVHLVPAYMTLVRDPVEKFVSYYRFKRVDHERVKTEMALRERQQPGSGRRWYWKKLETCVLQDDPECALQPGTDDFTSAIPFLCGQHDFCLKHGSEWALQRAKYTAEYEYSVVGLLEHWNTTLAVLEHYLPAFFQGVQQRYWSPEFTQQRHVNRNPKRYKPIPKEILAKLRDKMALEYDLYQFLKQRLYRQHASIADLLRQPTTKLLSKATEKSSFSAWDRLDIELRRMQV